MPDTSTIRVSLGTRAALRALAKADGATLDETIVRLLRAERQRRMGAALAGELPPDDTSWIDGGLTVARESGRR
jgi:hypothetical protein